MTSKPHFERFGEAIRQRRRQIGLSQTDFAQKLHISRQNLSEIEAGRRLPQLTLASDLASTLGWSLDALAGYLPESLASRGIAWSLGTPLTHPSPVVWTLLDGRLTVAPGSAIGEGFSCDGWWMPDTGEVQSIAGSKDPAETLFIAGCDPFLSWLWDRTPHPNMTLYVFSLGSIAAIRALERGEVHFAGTHLYDASSGQYNRVVDTLPFATRRFQYLYWDEGMMGRAPEAQSWVLREPGSEARALFERNISDPGDRGTIELTSHWDIARYIRSHPKSAGVGLRAVAESLGLPFEAWSHEAFEWVTRDAWAQKDHRIQAFQSWLRSPEVRHALSRIPGIVPWESGRVVTPS